jgi:acyl transferase domain-containing protein
MPGSERTCSSTPVSNGAAASQDEEKQGMQLTNEPPRSAIAIIGMAGRFPGAPDLDAFWHNLSTGVESISFFARDELAAAGVPAAILDDPAYVPARGFLDGADLFDAHFFGFSPAEAEITDPQHRLLLECAWHALEHAGYAGEREQWTVGVFVGASVNTYLIDHLLSRPEVRAFGSDQLIIANAPDYLATRISYKLDLNGPSVNVQTACSTSLVAVHLACQSLLDFECDLALAGGASVAAAQVAGYLWREGGIASPDGHCRSFDAGAGGAVPGSGTGVVVLKRLEEAIRDGDMIHAAIRATAINNDGAAKVSFTAPSIDGQAEVIARALALAEVDPDSIGYVEGHGSGTAMGDPIEITALAKAFHRDAERRSGCALGSVKSNIGHLDAAAGVAGLIKTVLALSHRRIPPTLHLARPSPALAGTPFYVPRSSIAWESESGPRRASVSSFGMGGTNAHVVLEEAPASAPHGRSRPWQLLVWSAKSTPALEAATDRLAAHLAGSPEPLADLAHTLRVGRRAFDHRRILVCRDVEEARAALSNRDPRKVLTHAVAARDRPVAFLLSGLGDQYPGMASGLYRRETTFRDELDRCSELLMSHLGCDLREVLAINRDEEEVGPIDLRTLLGRTAVPAHDLVPQTRLLQPALFALEVALARLWKSWGVRPQALLGYSLGEYTAAHLAGVFTLEDALWLVAERARLIDELPPGAMLAVPLSEDRTVSRLGSDLSLAAVNGPELCVVAGPPAAVADLETALGEEGVLSRRLVTSHAFHSAMMEPIADRVAEAVAAVARQPPTVAYLSNVTGDWISPAEATDPSYWARHLCRPVRFGEAVAELWREPARVLLEIGPGQSLCALTLQHPAGAAGRIAVPSVRPVHDRQSDQAFLLTTLGKLWLAGCPMDWPAFVAGEPRRRVPAPLYPFERQRHWIEPRREVDRQAGSDPPAAAAATLAKAAAAAPQDTAAHRRTNLRTAYEPPASSLEILIAGLWEKVLGVDRVGRHDSFFELGGHSLFGLQVGSRLRNALGSEVPLRMLFDAPTVALLAQRLAGSEAAAPPAARGRTPRPERLPLSFSQHRLWFLQQLDPRSPALNIPIALSLTGRLDVRALARSFAEVSRRHESLRTVFVKLEGEPVQVITPPAPRPLPRVDLGSLPHSARPRELRRLADEEAARPFSLARWEPLWRTTLVRLADSEHAFLFTLHHLVGDGWSLGVLRREIGALYEAFAGGRPSPLPELAVQYADYALRQLQWLDSESPRRQLEYWRQHLAGPLPLLDLPARRRRPAVPSFKGRAVAVRMPPPLTAALHDLGRREGTTLFMNLLAAFAALLHYYTGQEDLIVGTDVANRTDDDLEQLIGCFVNHLALRTDLSGNPTFRELLGRVREVALGGFAHQDVPLEKLIEALHPQRYRSYAPLFQVMLVLHNVPLKRRRLPELEATFLALDNHTTIFDLCLVLAEVDAGLTGYFLYASDLFEDGMVARMAEQLVTLIEQVLTDPERRIKSLALADQDESRQMVGTFNDEI